MRQRKGMGLLAVLGVLALLGGAIVASMAQTGAISYQTLRMQQQSCVENLQASGAAWAKANRGADSLPPPGRPKPLDVTALDVPGGLLSVEALGPSAGGTSVRVTCQCGLGSRTMQGTMDVEVPPDRDSRK